MFQVPYDVQTFIFLLFQDDESSKWNLACTCRTFYDIWVAHSHSLRRWLKKVYLLPRIEKPTGRHLDRCEQLDRSLLQDLLNKLDIQNFQRPTWIQCDNAEAKKEFAKNLKPLAIELLEILHKKNLRWLDSNIYGLIKCANRCC